MGVLDGPCDTPPVCVALPSPWCPNKLGTSLPPIPATWAASSGSQRFSMSIREARNNQGLARLCQVRALLARNRRRGSPI